MRKIIPAFEFRRRAREAMKAFMPILLVVALIATLPSLISNTVTLMTEADPNTLVNTFADRLRQVMEKYGVNDPQIAGEIVIDEEQLQADITTVYDLYMQELQTFLKEKGPIVLVLALMVLIASPVLTLGMINALLHALRKQEFTPVIALSRMKYILKALGLELLVAIKVFLWTLPGALLMVAALFMPQTLMTLTLIVGFAVMLVLGIMAGYRYAMAVFVLADEPQTRIRACIRRSCEVMQHRKMELFSLELSFIGWSLLLSYVQIMFNAFGAVIGMTLGMFASLFLTVYTNCAQAAFYQEYAVGPVQSAEGEKMPGMNDLNE